ncbi:MAG TPA: DUF3329 domain-containing protein [Devosiaceae bacterium]|nr:DUF3329 domain-containing protein [Devosiaceae bacterium]
MKERDIQFFRPLWRRIAVVAVCVVWAVLELLHGEQLWIFITLGLTAYAVWMFFISFPKEAPPAESKEDQNVPPPA